MTTMKYTKNMLETNTSPMDDALAPAPSSAPAPVSTPACASVPYLLLQHHYRKASQ